MSTAIEKSNGPVQTAQPMNRPQTVQQMLTDPKMKMQIAAALPRHLTADRLARIVLTQLRTNPKLAKCEPTSFMAAVMQCAQLGLEPGGILGHCYLVPFENRKKNIVEVNFIVGYKGMIDLARRSKEIISLAARVVYDCDEFTYEFGLEETMKHVPKADRPKDARPVFFYAVAKLHGGGKQFDVMSYAEICEVRDGSQGYQAAVKYKFDSPWITHFPEMGKKTVIRRLFKYLPVSVEIQKAVAADELADAGVSQDNALLLDSPAYKVEEVREPGDDVSDHEPGDVGDK